MNVNMAWVQALRANHGAIRDFQSYLEQLVQEGYASLRTAKSMDKVIEFQTQISVAERIDRELKEFIYGGQHAGRTESDGPGE